MRRPGSLSLPAKLVVAEALVAIAAIVALTWVGALAPSAANAPVAFVVGGVGGWQLREAFTAWRNHRKLARLRADQRAGVASLFTEQLRARLGEPTNTEEKTQ